MIANNLADFKGCLSIDKISNDLFTLILYEQTIYVSVDGYPLTLREFLAILNKNSVFFSSPNLTMSHSSTQSKMNETIEKHWESIGLPFVVNPMHTIYKSLVEKKPRLEHIMNIFLDEYKRFFVTYNLDKKLAGTIGI